MKRAKAYHAEWAFYVKADISDKASVTAACEEALRVIPKGSLAGGVHCAAIAPGRKWSHKLLDSVDVSLIVWAPSVRHS